MNTIRNVLLDKYKKFLISYAFNDNQLKIWDYNNGAIVANLQGHSDIVIGAYANGEQNTLISYTERGELIYWNYT